MIQVNKSTTLEDFYRQLGGAFPMLFGREVVLETAATGATQKLPHGLGRPYRGAFQLRSDAVSFLVIADPALQDDADVNLTFVDAGAAAGNTTVWVF